MTMEATEFLFTGHYWPSRPGLIDLPSLFVSISFVFFLPGSELGRAGVTATTAAAGSVAALVRSMVLLGFTGFYWVLPSLNVYNRVQLLYLLGLT